MKVRETPTWTDEEMVGEEDFAARSDFDLDDFSATLPPTWDLPLGSDGENVVMLDEDLSKTWLSLHLQRLQKRSLTWKWRSKVYLPFGRALSTNFPLEMDKQIGVTTYRLGRRLQSCFQGMELSRLAAVTLSYTSVAVDSSESSSTARAMTRFITF